nr:HIT domain protein [uncultured bacterium]
MKETFVNLDNARFDNQRQVMEEIKTTGDCPFCQENLAKYHSKPVIRESTHWSLTENAYPYDGAKYHFLLIAKIHGETLADISPNAGADLFKLLAWVEKKYAIESGAFALRFGDIRYNGASVRHLHVHLIVGDVHNPDHEKIRFKMSVPAKDSAANS